MSPQLLEPTEQVYRYDSVEHAIECVSCASGFDPEPKLGADFGKADNAQGTATDGVPRPSMISANGDFAFFQTPAASSPPTWTVKWHPKEMGATPNTPVLIIRPLVMCMSGVVMVLMVVVCCRVVLR